MKTFHNSLENTTPTREKLKYKKVDFCVPSKLEHISLSTFIQDIFWVLKYTHELVAVLYPFLNLFISHERLKTRKYSLIFP